MQSYDGFDIECSEENCSVFKYINALADTPFKFWFFFLSEDRLWKIESIWGIQIGLLKQIAEYDKLS